MGIRVGFLTTLGVNVGDEFIREGIRHVLDGCGVAYTPLYVNKHDRETLRRPVEDETEEVENKFWASDLFIQSGAPVYWHLGPHTSLTSEWYQWFWEELAFCPDPPAPPPILVNLGAGSTQAWGDDGRAFLADEFCVNFARRAARRAELTTVRDPLAARLLSGLGIAHHALPCPAFFAGGRHVPGAPVDGLIGVNLMPIASHYDLSGDFNRDRWHRSIHAMLGELRKEGRLWFICHDRAEAEFAARHRRPPERLFGPTGWRDYLDAYAHCDVVLANRVHGAVCAAGMGVPAILIGNDTRAEIADWIGLRRFHANRFDPAEAVAALRQLRRNRTAEQTRLRALREEAVQKYRALLQPIVDEAATGKRPRTIPA